MYSILQLFFLFKLAYDKAAHSEVVVGRVVHLLTLRSYAWDDTNSIPSKKMHNDKDGEIGSVFFKYALIPNQLNWVESTLLGDPKEIMCSSEYDQQESMLEFLNRLAKEGGKKHYEVQDKAIRDG